MAERVEKGDLKRNSDGQLTKKLEALQAQVEQSNQPQANGNRVSYVFTAAATQFPVKHGLKRMPIGFMIMDQRTAGSVYRGTNRSDSTHMYLQSSAVGTDVDIWFY